MYLVVREYTCITQHIYINKRKTKENTPTRTHACTSPRGARRSTRRRRRREEEEEEAIVRSLSPTNANRHLAIRGTGETAKREQVFPGLTRNRG